MNKSSTPYATRKYPASARPPICNISDTYENQHERRAVQKKIFTINKFVTTIKLQLVYLLLSRRRRRWSRCCLIHQRRKMLYLLCISSTQGATTSMILACSSDFWDLHQIFLGHVEQKRSGIVITARLITLVIKVFHISFLERHRCCSYSGPVTGTENKRRLSKSHEFDNRRNMHLVKV